MPYTKNNPMMDKLGKAISEGDLPSVELICQSLPKGFNINTVFEYFLSGVGKGRKGKGHTPLTFALQKHQNAIAEYLIEHCSANITVAGRLDSPLMTAIKVMNKEGIDILLKYDDINGELLSSKKSSNPLYQLQEMYTSNNSTAIRKNILSLSRKMIARGANQDFLSDNDFLKRLTRSVSTTATPIGNLTTMSPTAAREVLQRNVNNFINSRVNVVMDRNSAVTPSENISTIAATNPSQLSTIVNTTVSSNGNSTALSNDSIPSTIMNETTGSRGDYTLVDCEGQYGAGLITGIVSLISIGVIAAGAWFGIKRYNDNENYSKALEMTPNNSSKSSTSLI